MYQILARLFISFVTDYGFLLAFLGVGIDLTVFEFDVEDVKDFFHLQPDKHGIISPGSKHVKCFHIGRNEWRKGFLRNDLVARYFLHAKAVVVSDANPVPTQFRELFEAHQKFEIRFPSFFFMFIFTVFIDGVFL